ncbi:hypothetical protein FOA52_011847 [Chlamydomonas sp. UWO 241]|nr:hypothetical protein FOA52_011847 [Chlamydomonas sp. UWO 241]
MQSPPPPPPRANKKGKRAEQPGTDAELLDTDSEGRTALHRALISKQGVKTVLALLERCEKAAQVADRAGLLPLHVAASFNAPLTVINALLIAHWDGAKVKQKGWDWLPLHCAAARDAALEVVNVLYLAFTPGAAEADCDGRLPLHHAAAAETLAPEVVIALLDAYRDGASKLDKYSNLPLHFACSCTAGSQAQTKVVYALLGAHPDGVKQKTKSGRLPLHFAAARKAPLEVVDALLAKYQAGAQQLTDKAKLPLHLAAGNLAPFEVIMALLEAHPAGASALAGRAGNLPLYYAVQDEASPEVAAALLVAHPRDASQALQTASTRGPEWRAAFANVVARAARGVRGVPRAWHEIAKVEVFAKEVADIVKKDSSMATLADAEGVTAMEVAVGECRKAMREAIAFLGRYHLDAPVHTSATCTVWLARDLQLPGGDPAGAVALKLMSDEEAFLREVQTRVGLDEKFVVGILRVHIAPSGNNRGGRRAAHALLTKCQDVEGKVHDSFDAVGPYRLCIVMPRGDRSLLDALQHERFAGKDWDRIRRIGEDVMKALGHMHVEGIVHCDVKPLNVMRIGETWRLIDLDVTQQINEAFGSKAPSSGYCAPELAKALLAAFAGAGGGGSAHSQGGLMAPPGGALSGVCANVALDLWSFGALLFYMSAACQLLPTDLEDNLGMDELKSLASWTQADLNRRLAKRGLATGHDDLVDLLSRLLEPEPATRLAHWAKWVGTESVGVLEHKFFRPHNTDMRELREGIDSIYTVVIDSNAKLDLVLQGMQAHTRMMSSILTGDREVPSLLCFTPAQASNKSWMNPSQWLHTVVHLRFVCPVSMEFDPVFFPVKIAKEWFKKAMPYIKAGLIVLKIASAAGRCAGFPIPDFAGGLDQVLTDQFKAMEEMRDALGGDLMDEGINATMGAIDDAINTGQMSDDVRAATDEQLRWSCTKVKELLVQSGHGDWKDKIVLKQAFFFKDGSCEWVLPKYVAEFEASGRTLLGAHSTQQTPVTTPPQPPQPQPQPPQQQSLPPLQPSPPAIGAASNHRLRSAPPAPVAASAMLVGTPPQGSQHCSRHREPPHRAPSTAPTARQPAQAQAQAPEQRQRSRRSRSRNKAAAATVAAVPAPASTARQR